MSLSLASLQDVLRCPFPPEKIRLLPKLPRKNEQGQWKCLALPYADKRTYEDRLNELAFGEWSTPLTAPLVAGNKLIVPVAVVICGVSRTDYGEAFLSSLSRKGEKHEEENSATEAYSQGFRRACAQFGLGRYLYDLPKLWLPYDPTSGSRPIPISDAERIAWIEKLYMQAGLPPRPEHPAVAKQAASDPEQASHGSSLAPSSSSHQTGTSQQRVDTQLLAFLRRETTREQQQKACHFYHVEDLAHLTPEQALHLSDYIEARKQVTSA
ncbi:hypothetical protein KSF_065910 [Reticulibacter mediterranei]|uniref:Uncharacterized protein n=1 Tax=Reticulibacter mediterranei TaxID=2778369 RepID=A0A8J3IM82_9CHLR|nr:Rad52/Rad22 family DNA repair protein [Reticulibacter mediterranei]GHO96543.1 hypothetical protein KSF_065910 [Reticulibacter mediterranei]